MFITLSITLFLVGEEKKHSPYSFRGLFGASSGFERRQAPNLAERPSFRDLFTHSFDRT